MAGKKERQRRLARERYERNLSRRAAQQERTRRITGIILACLVVVGLGVGGFFLFGPANHPAAATPSSPATTPATTPPASPSPSAAAPVAEPAHTCAYNVSGTAARKVALPPKHPDFRAHYQATIRTNRGNIVIDLLNSKVNITLAAAEVQENFLKVGNEPVGGGPDVLAAKVQAELQKWTAIVREKNIRIEQ